MEWYQKIISGYQNWTQVGRIFSNPKSFYYFLTKLILGSVVNKKKVGVVVVKVCTTFSDKVGLEIK